MTEAEKKHFKEVHAQMQIGYAIAEKEWARQIRETDTKTALLQLLPAFSMAARDFSPRASSGLVEYYKALRKVYPGVDPRAPR